MPETAGQAGYYAKPGTGDGLAEMLLDIHGERLDLMNAHNVEHFVLVPLTPFRRIPLSSLIPCLLPPSLVPYRRPVKSLVSSSATADRWKMLD